MVFLQMGIIEMWLNVSGFINSLLSWKGIIPLSRLTYCSYLVHLVVMDTYYLSKRSLVYFTDLEEVSEQRCSPSQSAAEYRLT